MTIYTKEIKSLQHPFVKHLLKLRKSRKYRLEKKLLILEGKKMILEYQGEINTLLVTKKENVPCHLKPKMILIVSDTIIQKISGAGSAEPYLAEISFNPCFSLEGKKHLLGLDQVADPGNVGTLIRTAAAFRFQGVFLTQGCADPFMDKALRAAKGATFHLPIQIGTVEDLIFLIEKNRLTPYVADKIGSSDLLLDFSFILILGNEGKGVSKHLKEISQLLSILIACQTESLNVAVAGGILMHRFQEVLWPG